MKNVISVIPFIILFAVGLSAYLYRYEWYAEIEVYLANIFGFSIITNLVFAYLYFRKQFCIYTKIAVLGLLFMNLISIVYSSNDLIYNQMYDMYITLIVVFICFIFMVKKWF